MELKAGIVLVEFNELGQGGHENIRWGETAQANSEEIPAPLDTRDLFAGILSQLLKNLAVNFIKEGGLEGKRKKERKKERKKVNRKVARDKQVAGIIRSSGRW